MKRSLLALGSLILLARLGSCAEPLQLILYTPMNLDGGVTTASTTLQLRNPNTTPLPYILTIKNSLSKNTNREADWVVTFYGPDNKSGPMLTGNASGEQSFPVKVDLAHLVEAGQSTAGLFCNGTQIGILKVVKELGLPLRVSLEGSPPEKPDVEFVRGSQLDLHLKNDDPMNYPLSWELIVKGEAVSDSVPAGPNGSTKFTVHPASSWFSLYQSFFKDEVADGKLIVGYKPPGAVGAYPSKTIPIKARLSYYDPGSRDLVAIIAILFFLALGGAASAYVNVDLVNRIKVISIKKRLSQLARVVGEIGPQLNSQLRVSLWLERGRITATLPQGVLFTPETAAALAQSDTDTGVLKRRVELAESIAEAITRQGRAIDAGDVPPSLMDRVTRSLSAAQDLLKKSVPSDAELQRIRTHIGDAVNVIESLGTPDENLGKEITARWQDLRAKFTVAVLADPICVKIQAGAPIPFGWLAAAGPLGSQADQDANTRKLAVVYDLFQRQVAPAEIVECLHREDFGAVASAELLLRQIKEEVSSSNLRDAISANPPQVFVMIDRDTVRVNTPIYMKLVFNEPRYNRAAAKKLIECTWDLGHEGLTEKGWEIYHYFPTAKLGYQVKLTFKDAKQAVIPCAAPVDRTVNVSTLRPEGYAHIVVEVQRWAVGFLVAIITLFAGAKDKILTLDTLGAIFALFLVGFGIDVAKNLLVAKQPSTRDA